MINYHAKRAKDRADIMVATPILDSTVTTFYCDGYLEMVLHAPPKTRFARRHAFQRDIVRARSRLARQFLESECTHLLYVDGDNVPNSLALKGMLAADREVVACPYPRREIHPQLRPGDMSSCLRYSYVPHDGAEVDSDQCLQIQGIGFGFILIQRRVIELLTERNKWHISEDAMLALNGADIAPSFKDEIRLALRNFFVDDFPGNGNKETVALFSLYNTVDGKMLGEDYSFCARCRDAGVKIWMYLGPGTPVEHDGMMRFGQARDEIGVITTKGNNKPLPMIEVPLPEAHRSDDP